MPTDFCNRVLTDFCWGWWHFFCRTVTSGWHHYHILAISFVTLWVIDSYIIWPIVWQCTTVMLLCPLAIDNGLRGCEALQIIFLNSYKFVLHWIHLALIPLTESIYIQLRDPEKSFDFAKILGLDLKPFPMVVAVCDFVRCQSNTKLSIWKCFRFQTAV